MRSSFDTIVALTTAPGKSGVAVLRISGPDLKPLMAPLFDTDILPRKATYTHFYDPQKEIIDSGIALFFPNPHSFTGEDVLELHCHGSPIIVKLLINRIVALNVRMARPGEFSERAFLNGKMDLTQAEAIADLIDASSEHAARLAQRSLQGEFSKLIQQLNTEVIHLRMFVEAAIDFSDEEIDFLNETNVKQSLVNLQTRVQDILAQAKQGCLLREGFHAVIMGKPNVGKSSLLNILSKKEIAIVTAIAGTTRDVLRTEILIDDLPMHLVDTAGLRESDDVVEQEGIRRAYQELQIADVILHVLDGEDIAEIVTSIPSIFIHNKIDLLQISPKVERIDEQPHVYLSAKTGEGLELLKTEIKTLLGFQPSEGIFLARQRHLEALSKALQFLQAASCVHSGELIAEELRLCHRALGEITGEFTTDDLLGQIFSTFCVGK